MQDYLFAEANRVPRKVLSPVSGLERERVIDFLLLLLGAYISTLSFTRYYL